VAVQVQNALSLFSNNFMTAVKPQIVKLYAEGDKERMMKLVFESSKFSFFLLYVVSLPVFLEINYILHLWLKEVPQYTALFLRWIIAGNLIRGFANPVVNAVHATGNIKWLNLLGGGTSIVMQLPLTFLFYKLGFPAVAAFVVLAVANIICTFIELMVLHNQVNFSMREYIIKVYILSFFIAVLTLILPAFVYLKMRQGFLRLFLCCLTSALSLTLFVFIFGIDRVTRKKVIAFAKAKLQKNG
jgi:O-antigen/teichoic acid export membrane protein